MSLDPELEIHGQRVKEKQLLRLACSRWVPRLALERRKLDIGSGSGVTLALSRYAEQAVSDGDPAKAALHFPSDTPTTKEQLLYRRFFEDVFPGRWPRANVHRWRCPLPGSPESSIGTRGSAARPESGN